MLFIDVYKTENKIATSGATSLADLDQRRTYRAIDSVATGRIPSLFCGHNYSIIFTQSIQESLSESLLLAPEQIVKENMFAVQYLLFSTL